MISRLLLFSVFVLSSVTAIAQKALTIPDITSNHYAPKGVNIANVLTSHKSRLRESHGKSIYRRSKTAIYHLDGAVLADSSHIEQPLLSPNGNIVAYVKDNNLFLEDCTQSPATVKQITTDGKYNSIINGKPDWVYEEEFVYARAFCFNADGTMLCWQRFDETHVPLYSFPLYKGVTPERIEYLAYPGRYEYKYPMAGERNSSVTLHSYDIASGITRDITVPVDSDDYIPRILPTSDAEKMLVLTINRHQDCLKVYTVNPNTGAYRLILTDEVKPYINEMTYADIQMVHGGFVFRSERSGYATLYLYDLDGKLLRQLTPQSSDAEGYSSVVTFYGYDEKTGRCYYSAKDGSPVREAVFVTDKRGKTTKLTPRSGINRATFSDDYKTFVNTWSDLNTPPVYTLCSGNDGKVLKTLEDNHRLAATLDSLSLVRRELFTLTTDDGIVLYGWILKPATIQPGGSPAIMFQYSGPGSQQVMDQWSSGEYCGLYEQYLVQQGFVVVCVDGRGTGGRGADFEKQTYQHLGALESHDQVEVAKWLGRQPYVDAQRIGIWGWSYGGFNTLMSMSTGDNVFAAGVAVAPPTSYRYYDTVYTERFMRTPKENPDGYNDNPITRASKLHGALLICQGTADDNVHYRNVAEYIDALVAADKDFYQLDFTNRNHSIYGGNARNFLFRNITKWFMDKLTP